MVPQTAIISEGELFGMMGDYPTSFAINTLYQQDDPKYINTWFYNLETDFEDRMSDLKNGINLHHKKINSVFKGNSKDSIVIRYEPDKGQCLWILRPEDQENRLLPEATRDVLVISNIDRIQRETLPDDQRFLENIDGDPPRTWCYYYQKADLARQYNEWNQVVDLWEVAKLQELSPGNGVELIPFIEGYAYTGEWEIASDLSRDAKELTRQLSPLLCSTWDRLEADTAASDEREAAISELREFLGCPGS
jgi:hypothetical protein